MLYYVYIMASRRNGTLYTGVRNDIARRGFEHREGVSAGFTKRYSVKLLVYYEAHDDIQSAIEREKRLKKWNRAWKISLIEAANPKWEDLYETLAV
jgi:putative endonuclease